MHTNLATSFCFLFACAAPMMAQTPPLKSPYYPLEIDSKWTYRVRDAKTAEAKADPAREVVILVEREEIYTRKENKDGKDIETKHTGFLLRMTSGAKVTRDHVIILEQGIHRIHASGIPMNPPLLFFKLGVKPGETWTSETVSRDTTVKGSFGWKNDVVEVLHGKYPAILVTSVLKRGEERDEIDTWFVSGIGMVKQRIKSKNHDLVLELQSFTK